MSEIHLKVVEPKERSALSIHPASTNKVGLALSGGGFRAAFFHLGVLANLADQGILRHVEVISAVSGGSIVATLYYLHLKRLLESVSDADITDDDYRSIIDQMEQPFLAAVERNFRLSTFVSIRANWNMRRADYSRTDRTGELYDSWLFRPALAGPGGKLPTRPIQMRDLKIFPAGSDTTFHPRRHNVSRSAKVPILLINSTSLNTGRNWRFEASRMGESPPHGNELFDIDKVTRLERPHSYDQLPDHLARMPLGKAVAASTAVPGMFHPLPLSGLYPKRRLQLVDGGVHDNQGLQGLLDEACNTLIISDASGQLEEENKPVPSWGSVLLRANGILMSRVREEQLISRSRQSGGTGRKDGQTSLSQSSQRAALIHMKKGLTPEHITYRRSRTRDGKKPPSQTPQTPHPIQSASRRFEQRPGTIGPRPVFNEQVQTSLARVRTDLDSFTEIEAFSLMSDGYCVSEEVIPRVPAIANLRKPGSTRRSAWRFLAVEPWMHNPTPQYLKHLRTAGGSLFKVFRLAPSLSWTTLGCFVALLGFVLHFFGAWEWFSASHQVEFTWSWGTLLLLVAVGVAVIFGSGRLRVLWNFPVNLVNRPIGGMGRLLFQAILPIIGAVFIKIYLLTFDRLFLAVGRLERLGPVVDVRERRTTGHSGASANIHPS